MKRAPRKPWTGDRIRCWRESRNLTQGQLAEMLGVTRNYINLVENGHKTPVPGKTLSLLLDCLTDLRHVRGGSEE